MSVCVVLMVSLLSSSARLCRAKEDSQGFVVGLRDGRQHTSLTNSPEASLSQFFNMLYQSPRIAGATWPLFQYPACCCWSQTS